MFTTFFTRKSRQSSRLGKQFFQLKFYAKSASQFRLAVWLRKTAHNLHWLAIACLFCREFANSRKAIEEVFKLTSHPSPKMFATRSLVSLMSGNAEFAENDIKFALEHDTQAVHFLISYAQFLECSECWSQAAKIYSLIHSVNNSDIDAVRLLAALRATCPDDSQRNAQEAIALARRAFCLQEEVDWKSHSVLAAALAESGDFEAASEQAILALEKCPEEFRATRLQRLELYRHSRPYRRILKDV